MTTTLLQPTDEQIAAISENFHVGNRDTGMGYAFAWLDFARAVLAAQPAPAEPDCRTCARYALLGGHWCDYTGTKIKCINANMYEALPPVKLWRKP
jgi:hypothetical protein